MSNLRRQTVVGAAWLTGGKLGGQGLSLVRNVIVARMIGPEDLGLAATFVLTLSFIEAVSTLGVDRLLVQAKDGDSPQFQRTAHAVNSLRGALLAGGIFAASWWLAALFGAPEAVWAYQLVALVPLLRGLSHLDAKIAHRSMNFSRDTRIELGVQIALLALAWPTCAWLGDYRAAVALTVASGVLTLLGTHVVATRPYRWAWDRAYLGRITSFGWPLLINGVLLFLILQGDQFIIGAAPRLFGSSYTHGDLGQFAAAAGLALAVHTAIASISGTLFFPMLAACQENGSVFGHRYQACAELIAFAAVGTAALGIVLGPNVMTRVYGAQFSVAAGLFPLIMASQMVRLLRVAPNLAAMARADTSATALANAVRVLSFAGAVVVAARDGALFLFAAVALGAELLAGLVALVRLNRRSPLPSPIGVAPFVGGIMLIGVCLLSQRLLANDNSPGAQLGLGQLAVLVAIPLVALIVMAEVRNQGMLVLHQWRSGALRGRS
ncbi:MAG: oligosaccharide flippase family protein [Planctomycetota bacterium]|nr:oligosaccharide flippase family protein [Planctomycetota bacterium]